MHVIWGVLRVCHRVCRQTVGTHLAAGGGLAMLRDELFAAATGDLAAAAPAALPALAAQRTAARAALAAKCVCLVVIVVVCVCVV